MMIEHRLRGHSFAGSAAASLLAFLLMVALPMPGRGAMAATQDGAAAGAAATGTDTPETVAAATAATATGASATGAGNQHAPVPAEPAGQPAQAASPITEAERLLFMTDHVDNVQRPATLRYRFTRSGTLKPGYEGMVSLSLTQDAPPQVEFLDGSDRLELPSMEVVEGNPVLLYFLEHELREMKQLTRGSISYYRKRIRMALAADPAVKLQRQQFHEREITVRQVRVDPYRNDPAADRFEAFIDRYYEFEFSDDVPGKLLRLRSILPARDGGEARMSETLEFDQEQKP